MANAIIDTFDLWTTAQNLKTSNRGLSASNQSLLGIKKLRELILELAVRGKLVPQDPKDEPANVLLEKIEKEKKRLVREGVIKKQDAIPEVGEAEKPYKLPVGWQWIRIRNAGHEWGQKTPASDFTYIDVSAIDNTKGEIQTPTFLKASEAPSRARKIVKPGTVIYSTVRPYLKNICVIDKQYSPEPIASTAFAIMHPYLQMPGRFFLLYLQSPVFVRYVESVQNGIAYPAINDKQFFGGLLPLPPLAEQHRIVSKVDELMALCDKLEQKQTNANEAHQTLVDTLLGTLTNAESPAAFDEAWQRISNHFDTLLTTEHSIDQLKQTILQLAVMGKLVPQNPKDEQAYLLIKKIKEKKEKLIRNKQLKSGKSSEQPLSFVEEYPTIANWAWCKADDIFFITKLAGFEYTEHIKLTEKGEIPVVRAQNVKPFEIDKSNVLYIPKETSILLDRCSLTKKCLLFTFIGAGIGDVATFDEHERWHLAPNVAKAEPFEGCEDMLNVIYVNYYMMSETGQKEIFKHLKATAQPSLSMGTIRDIDIAFPPILEQDRIVAKVNELFALCNTLKERLRDAQALQNQLSVAVVEQAE